MNLSWVDIVDPYFGEAMFTKCGLAWSRGPVHKITVFWWRCTCWNVLVFL